MLAAVPQFYNQTGLAGCADQESSQAIIQFLQEVSVATSQSLGMT